MKQENSNNNNQSYLRIFIKANEYIRAQELINNISKKIPTDIQCGRIYLPKKIHRFSLQDSPHAYGATRSTFGYDNYKVCFTIGEKNNIYNAQFNALLLAIKEAGAVSGTFIKFKVIKKNTAKAIKK